MAGIKERLIQVILRGKDLLSPEAKKGKAALDELRESGEQLRTELDKAKEDNSLVRSLTSLGKESERAEKTADRTAEKVVQLRDELNKNPDSKGLSQSLTIAEREAAKAQTALDKLKQEATDYAAKAKAAGIDTSKLSDEEKRLAAELVKAKGAVTDNAKATKDLQREQSAAARSTAEQRAKTTRLREAIKTAEKRVLGYALAYISLKAAMSGVKAATDFIVSGFKSVFSGASESEQILGQLNAALASTEGVAGLTAEALARMGVEMRKGSLLSIEQITQMQTALLTYSDIAADEFPRALQIAIDQQQRLGISVTQSAELVGMALQSPSKAMTALGRQGFTLEQSQKDLLKQFEDTGRMAEAQAIIMDMLAESYGGSAAAAKYGTFEGLWKGITDTFEDFKSKIADSGSFDYLKNKLEEVEATLESWTQDGTLDNLAIAISDTFVAGAEKVDEFIRSIADVNFKQLIDDSAEWLSDFGSKVDEAVELGQAVGRVFTGVWHSFRAMVTSAATAIVGAVNLTVGNVMRAFAAVADAVGLDELAEKTRFAYGFINELQESFANATIESAKKVAEAIEGSSERVRDSKKAEQEAFDAAEISRKNDLKLAQLYADQWIAAHKNVGDEARLAAVEGRRNLEDLADALKVIDATESVTELDKLRKALLNTYQEGNISLTEYQQSTGVLNGKIKQLGKTAEAAAKDFKTLNGVMDAIATAVNDLDVRQAKAALDKLYREGKVNAEQHAKAQDALNKKVAELKVAAESSTTAVKEQGKALKDTAGSAKGTASAVSDVGSAAEEAATGMNFFDEVLSRARTPLAEMSAAALDAFDALSGINKLESSFDTSSLDKTTESLGKARNAIAGYQTELGLMGSRASGFGIWAMETLERSERIKVSFLQQKAALQKLQEGYADGAINAKQFAEKAADARKEFDLLDDSDLSALEGAVDAAKQKMDQLADSTKSTLQSLNDELLQLKGTQEEIEKSKMDSRRRDLQSQLVEARKDGDDRAVKNLQQALNTLSEIESERERVARNKKADDAKAEAEKAAQEQPAKKQEPTKIIKLQVGSQSVDVGVDSSRDEAALLSILEQAGLRSM